MYAVIIVFMNIFCSIFRLLASLHRILFTQQIGKIAILIVDCNQSQPISITSQNISDSGDRETRKESQRRYV